MSKVILSEESLFIETEVTGDGANETTIEDAAGELSPVFVFEGFEEPGSDAGALRDFFQCDLAELALALETFSEISLGHAFYLRTSVAATQLQANTLVVKGAGFRGEPEAASSRLREARRRGARLGAGRESRRAGWQDGNACTTGRLRRIFRGAYTDHDWQMRVSKLGGGQGERPESFLIKRRHVET